MKKKVLGNKEGVCFFCIFITIRYENLKNSLKKNFLDSQTNKRHDYECLCVVKIMKTVAFIIDKWWTKTNFLLMWYVYV